MILKLSANVESSAISSISYNAKASSLTVGFKSGRNYVYAGVPSHVVQGMLNADSAGKFFTSFIKGKYQYIEL